MERHYLICGMIGWFCAKEPHIASEDLRVKIDQTLSDSKFTPLGTEDGDLQLVNEMVAEFLMSVMGRKFNRKDRRQK